MSVAAPSSSPQPAASEGITAGFLERLGRRTEQVQTYLCLGVDPDPDAFPDGFSPDAHGLERFGRLLVEAGSRYAAAIKANLAFFEAFGSAGMAALERIRADIPADIPFIADAKRADISSTAARQVVALFDALGADAVTLNPYLGLDAVAPFLERSERFVYLVCRTSNPGAAEFQAIPDEGGQPLYLRVAMTAQTWPQRGDQIGLVVGATAPSELAEIREAAPSLPFLVPGIGAQGGDIDATRAHGPVRRGAAAKAAGGGLLVNVSRAIASAATGSADPATAISRAAAQWAERLHI